MDTPISSSHPPSKLPMVVWLKGDETYFNEFSLDADSAMEALGIKRSRLTQISGRELRVGRARLDRYIRPLYRPTDIEEYIEWSKPTHTSKQSSGLLQQAAEQLAMQGEKIQSAIEKPVAQTEQTVKEVAQKLEASFIEQTLLIENRFRKSLHRLTLELEHRFHSLDPDINNLLKGLHTLAQIQGQLSQLESIHKDLTRQNGEMAVKFGFIWQKMKKLDSLGQLAQIKEQTQLLCERLDAIDQMLAPRPPWRTSRFSPRPPTPIAKNRPQDPPPKPRHFSAAQCLGWKQSIPPRALNTPIS